MLSPCYNKRKDDMLSLLYISMGEAIEEGIKTTEEGRSTIIKLMGGMLGGGGVAVAWGKVLEKDSILYM
jgi:hypothetical protein